jgi:hypothetical protein
MDKLEIIKRLKEYNKDVKHLYIDELINELYTDVQKETYIKGTGDRGKLNAIKRVISNKKNDYRPTLQTFSLLDNHVVFTDSYQAYYLNDSYLPNFKIAYNDSNKEDVKRVAEQNDIEIFDCGVYPTIDWIFNRCKDTSLDYKYININTKDLLLEIKTAPEDLITFNDGDDNKITISTKLLKNAIDILKLKGDITIKYTSEIEPSYIENNGEIACLLPVKTY